MFPVAPGILTGQNLHHALPVTTICRYHVQSQTSANKTALKAKHLRV